MPRRAVAATVIAIAALLPAAASQAQRAKPQASPDGASVSAASTVVIDPAGGHWSFGALDADGVNAAVLLNGSNSAAQGFHASQIVLAGGAIYVKGLTVWWRWNGQGFEESGPPPAHASGASPPPGAASAGYTTLALDNDFSKPLPANWLGGCGQAGSGQPVDNSDTHGHQWWLNIWWAKSYQHCIVAQRPDPQTGETVLDLPWHVEPEHAAYGTTIEGAAWTAGGTVVSFPHSSYYEITARISPTNVPGVFLGFHTWGAGGVYDQNCGCVIEWDVAEVSDSDRMRMDSAVHNWGYGGGGWVLYPWRDEDLAAGTGLNPDKYNVYGLRVTYDGAGIAVGCTYINNVFQRCAETVVGNAEPSAAGRSVLFVLSACDHWNGPCQAGVEQHVYVKAIRVFSCPDWQMTHCPRPLLRGP